MLNHLKEKKEKGGLASMNDKEIEKQINDIIEGEIQNTINEYLEQQPEGEKGFSNEKGKVKCKGI